jgi:hypothetical protein
MRKLLFLLFFGCLSANVWAQQPVWDTLFFVKQTLNLYTDSLFLTQCSAVHFQKNKSKYTVFTVGDTNNVQPNRTRLCFIWDKKSKKLTEVQQNIVSFNTDTADYAIFLMKICFNKKIKTAFVFFHKITNTDFKFEKLAKPNKCDAIYYQDYCHFPLSRPAIAELGVFWDYDKTANTWNWLPQNDAHREQGEHRKWFAERFLK